MIIIKKRVSLEFLGEDYKEAYLVFKSIPAVDFDGVMQQLKTIEGKEEGSLKFLLEILQRYFVSGEFPNEGKLEPVVKEDLGQLDATSIIECFKVFTGQELDPKVETPLTSSLPTEE
jgi:hypothetical protein